MLRNRRKGFTLIEIMISVAVVATIMAISLNTMTQHQEHYKVEKAILQAQSVLEYAGAFHKQWKRWPQQFEAMNDPLASQLMTSCAYQSPASSKNNPCFIIQSGTSDLQFRLLLTLPSNLKNAQQIAEKISAALPHGFVVHQNPMQVTTALGVNPASPKIPTLVGIFPFLSNGSSVFDHNPNPYGPPITLNACPAGDNGLDDVVVDFTIANYSGMNTDTSHYQGKISAIQQVIGVCPGSEPGTPCSASGGEGTLRCDVGTVVANPTNNGQLTNPLIIPSGSPLPQVYPYICNVMQVATNDGIQIDKMPAFNMGIATEVCYPPGTNPYT